MKTNNLKPRDILLFDCEIIFFIMLTLFSHVKMLTSQYSLFFSILQGISFTFMITRTIHDCNHGGLTKKKQWKRYLFTFINEIITTNQSWQSKHNLHHMHTNDIEKDPDVDQFFRLSNKQTPKKHHLYQSVYTLFLYPMYVLSQIVVSGSYKASNSPEPVHKKSRFLAKMFLAGWIYSSIKYGKFKYWIGSMLLSGFYLAIS